MGAKTKPGLNYFQIDIDFFDDPNTLMLEDKYGFKGSRILMQLLCMIYRNGYYIEYTNDTPFVLAKRVGNSVTGALVGEVIDALVKFRFFDEVQFQSGVLTSKGIQKRWLSTMKNLKRKDRIKREHLLIDEEDSSEEKAITSEEIRITSELIDITSEEKAITSDSKEEKRIEKNRKEIKKEVDGATSGSKGSNIINDLLNIFIEEYQNSRLDKYLVTTLGKENQAIGIILNKIIKQSYPAADTEEVKQRARTLFRKCLEVKDKWHFEKMSPTHIAYNYNNIKVLFKNINTGIVNGKTRELPNFLRARV